MIHLHLHHSLATHTTPSERVHRVAAMFGLGADSARSLTIVPPISLTLRPHQLLFITGPSGSGKSTLLRLIRHALAERGRPVIDFDTLAPAADKPLVDCLDAPLEDTLRYLCLAGLSDAFVMLRKPPELSDGQRYRLRLALALAHAERPPKPTHGHAWAFPFPILLADEFTSTLDRLTAHVIARNLRKHVTRTPVCFIAATTHDDLLEPLEPDTLIVQHPGERIEVHEKPEIRNPKPESNPKPQNPNV